MIPRFWQSVVAYGSLGVLLLQPPVAAADDDLGVTMRMVTDDADLTESVVREIELREPVALERRDGNAGPPASNRSNAREASDRGREAARSATERAREVRDRNEQRERPDRPERPDVSERPERPEQPGLR